jgi:hypothetical protein
MSAKSASTVSAAECKLRERVVDDTAHSKLRDGGGLEYARA